MSDDKSSLPVFLTAEDVSKMIHMSVRTLETRRMDGTGPKFIKLGPSRTSKVIYPLVDVLEWLEQQRKG